MKKLFICILSVILIITCFSSCTNTAVSDNSEFSSDLSANELKIVTTIFPIYDWVRNITGSDANITYLDESGIDLHSFEPTASDILALSSADIFICIGGTSDEWVDNAVSSAQNDELCVIKLADITGVLEEETVKGMESEHDHDDETEYDEHIWLSLKKAQKAVEGIADVLCSFDSENSSKYKSNADSYISQLTELDEKYASAIENTTGDTLLFADRFPFRYLVEDYSLNYYAAFSGCSAESEASFETIAFLIEKTNELNLEKIIILESSDGKIASTISSETGAEVVTLNSCQSVTQDDVADGITYISIMEENLSVITEALG